MPRPRRQRRIRFQPGTTHFKPAGIRLSAMNEVVLTMGEFEAVRLKDFEDIDQTKAAKKMNISQPTFARLIDTARKKIADAIVNGKAIRIQGGNYQMVKQPGRGAGRGQGGQGRGRMGGGFAAGPSGVCRCPKCGKEVPHQRGQPCYDMKCPKCGTQMTRG
ncbi:DUF134 domain-containing protein [Candidatus Woesearchaeota archaeon]|nr:DUF134 domain-containing protein [Candidatus Woesearchaeota archaeon]